MKRKVNEKNVKLVEELKKLIKSYPIFGIVDMTNLPALQLQRIKKKLRDTMLLKMTKKRLIKIALNQLNMKEEADKVRGMPALIFTKENSFKLYKVLNQNRSNASAKAGQIAPEDIYIKAGGTKFTPGPVIGELGQLGIKTEVKEGKVAIAQDKLLVKEGKAIGAKEADLLSKLGVEPMKVGLNLVYTYENGILFDKSVLSVDEGVYRDNIRKIRRDALALSLAIGYVSRDNIKLFIRKAFKEVLALADARNIITKENIGKILNKAEIVAYRLKGKLKV